MSKVLTFVIAASLSLCFLFGEAVDFSGHEELGLHHSLAKQAPAYSYPYHDLPTQLAAEGKSHLILFSYGSLMDKNSAARTLSPEALATRRPALAYGVKRTFALDVPITETSRWGIPYDPNARGMLNIQATDNLDDIANGVLIDVPLADIPALLERETGYDLIPIVAADWNALLAGRFEPAIAYTLSAPASLTNPAIYPRPGYYELARDASKQFDPLYEKIWYLTTYLSDLSTPICAWEEFVQLGDPRTTAAPKKEQGKSVKVLPYEGILVFEPYEHKVFSFGKGTITVINQRNESIWLHAFNDEGVPVFAMIKDIDGYRMHGRHYALHCPRPGENLIIVIDESFD